MEKIRFDLNWNFKEIVCNIEALKTQIWGIIASFSYFELKEQVLFKRYIKETIYSYNFEKWRCDRLLEYIYGDIEFEVLKKLL